VPNFEQLSKGITDPVNRAFFKNFCDRCSKFPASDVPAFVSNLLLPRLRADSVMLRAAALRWPAFASSESKKRKMRMFCQGGAEAERANCKAVLLEIVPRCFSPASHLILDRIWDQTVPLEYSEVAKGICGIQAADEALAREIIDAARGMQAQAEKVPAVPDGPPAPEPHGAFALKRGSFGGCGSSCSEDHSGMACDVCGVDFGWHSGKCSVQSAVLGLAMCVCVL